MTLQLEEVVRQHFGAQAQRPGEQDAALRCADATWHAWEGRGSAPTAGRTSQAPGSGRGRGAAAAAAACSGRRRLCQAAHLAFPMPCTRLRRRMRVEHLKARGDEELKQGNYRLAWERCVQPLREGCARVQGGVPRGWCKRMGATLAQIAGLPTCFCARCTYQTQVWRGAGAGARQGRPACSARQPLAGVPQSWARGRCARRRRRSCCGCTGLAQGTVAACGRAAGAAPRARRSGRLCRRLALGSRGRPDGGQVVGHGAAPDSRGAGALRAAPAGQRSGGGPAGAASRGGGQRRGAGRSAFPSHASRAPGPAAAGALLPPVGAVQGRQAAKAATRQASAGPQVGWRRGTRSGSRLAC